MLRRIESARQRGLIGDLDAHFARAVAAWGGEHAAANSPPVLLAAALLSQLTRSGHVCLDLAALAELPVLDGNMVAPPLNEWLAALNEHPACGDAAAYTPLVLDGSRLYMRRYFDYECAVAAGWSLASARAEAQVNVDLIAQLFPTPEEGEDKQRDQRAAAIAALKKHRVLISGGPGTGKTTTLASILGLLIATANEAEDSIRTPDKPALKIALAAPTGKAAARMQEAIRSAKARLPFSDEVRVAMPEAAQTLHRLLGARPQGGGMVWRHDASNPLDCDVLVIDEASMIDIAMMARTLSALQSHARLILLGDKDQLASVDAGAVFADLCSAGAATLNVSFRFNQDSGIAQLAAYLRDGDADNVARLMQQAPADVHWVAEANRHKVVDYAVTRYAAFIEKSRRVAVEHVFDDFAAFRLLTPLRQGALGVAGLNAAIEQGLVSKGAVPPRQHWYAGKPVMVTANDYGLQLFNGDIGICVRDAVSGELRIAFASDELGVRLLPPARLPPHETAWAMTVHKSQGSEFDEVALVLPSEQSEVVTRELVYTAVTRARKKVAVWAEAASLKLACERRIVRHSGLVERLNRLI